MLVNDFRAWVDINYGENWGAVFIVAFFFLFGLIAWTVIEWRIAKQRAQKRPRIWY